MEKQRVAAYCRVSSNMDSQDGSFETQMSYYRQKLSANCYELVDVYGDHGKSGKEMNNRPEFQRMIADAEAGKIDVIFCKSISRFARNMAECISMIRHLKELGVVMVFEREGMRTDAKGVELILRVRSASPQNQAIADNRSIEQRICNKSAKRSRQRDLSLLVRFMQRRATPITQKDVSRR